MKSIILKLIYMAGVCMTLSVIIPPGKFEKQIRLIFGMIFSMMILSMFFYAFDAMSVYLTSVGNHVSVEGIYEEDGRFGKYILSDYVSSLQEDMTEKLTERFGKGINAEVVVLGDVAYAEFGKILSVTITGAREEDAGSVKKLINSFYDVAPEHISVYIKGG